MTIVETSVFGVDPRPLPDQAGAVATRHKLYEQIAHLERELTTRVGKLEPGRRPRPSKAAATRPHLLSEGELERTRDELLARIRVTEDLIERQSAGRSGARALLKRMTEMPGDFPWATVTTKDLGTKECRAWQSVPVLGPIGMLGNWWRIRMSSGCP
jgi:hypothetical protein